MVLVMAIGGRPKPEICFLSRRWLRRITQWPWVEHPIFQLWEGLYDWAITVPV